MVNSSDSEVFSKLDFEKYKGKWIAICDEDIVSSGENAKIIFEEAYKKYPKKRIVIARVPEEQAMIY